MKIERRLPVVLVSVVIPVLTAFSCNPLEEIAAKYEGDLQPPRILGLQVTDVRSVVASFDEPLAMEEVTVVVDPPVPVASAVTDGSVLRIGFLEPLSPGAAYAVEASVRDTSSNTTTFVAGVHGLNDRVPELVITEFTPQGSGRHPDVVEVLAKTAGNLAGVVLVEGSRSVRLDEIVFPSVEVAAGDYVLVHFRPEGSEDEVNETADPTASGGNDATPSAFDFWVEGGDGLSGNNGALALYASPSGALLDAVVYSNRTAASDDRYRGFGSKRVLEMVDEIVAEGGWRIAGDSAYPEDAVNPEASTATRSICRDSEATDTNSASDWHIVPTRGATFGAPNSNEVHVP